MKKIKPRILQKVKYSLTKIKVKKYIKDTYSFKAKPFDLKGPFIIVSNRITHDDQYLLMLSFKHFIYFTFSENLYRQDPKKAKWQESLGGIPYKIALPITDYKKQIIDLIKFGNNVCLFPELYTNYCGITSPIDPAIGEIIKEANCTLVTYSFRGGYLTEPAWAKSPRKGWLSGQIVNVYSKYDLSKLSNEQVNKLVEDDLKEDAYARQCNSPITYSGDDLALGIENVLYLCPKCGEYDSFASNGNDFYCTKCDTRGSYTDQGIIHGNFRFKTITDFVRFEEAQIDRLADSDTLFKEDDITLYEIKDNHKQEKIIDGQMTVNKDGITINDYIFNYTDINKLDVDNHGESLMFSHKDKYYLITKPNFKALKYRKLYYKRKANIETYGTGPKIKEVN